MLHPPPEDTHESASQQGPPACEACPDCQEKKRKEQIKRLLRILLFLAPLALFFFVVEWVWLDDLPTALTELQYAGNPTTARIVLDAWQWVGITPDRIGTALALDALGLLYFAAVLAWAAWAAELHFRDGAGQWTRQAIAAAAVAAVCGLLGDAALLGFVALPSGPTLLLRSVFFLITLKTFLFSAILLYAVTGFGQSRWAGGFWDATRACGFSLFAALAGPGLLAFGHQGTAIFGVIFEDMWPAEPHADRDPRLYFMALAGTLYFSLMCWGAARYAVSYKEAEKRETKKQDVEASKKASRSREAQKAVEEKRADPVWKAGWEAGERWVPRFCGLAPSALIVLVILLADHAEIQSKGTAIGVGAVSALVALIIWAHTRFRDKAMAMSKAQEAGAQMQSKDRLKTFDLRFERAYQGFVGIGAIFVFAGCFGPHALKWLTLDLLGGVGPLAAWFFSFSLIVPTFTFLVTAGRRSGKPFLALVLAYGFLINAADLNDDHGLRYTDVPAPPPAAANPPDPKALNTAFDDWLGAAHAAQWSRAHGGKPYPVLFVAAAGGGIVAGGVLTASMAELQTNLGLRPLAPEDHLFAISSVSGGSIGAVTYTVLRDQFLKSDGDFPHAANKVMTSDMLSPTIASLLGPEMIQRFLPFAIPNVRDQREGYHDGFAEDRGRALELAFETALANHTRDKAPLQAATMLADYPSPAVEDTRYRRLPALFLNTTCVETGQRMVISTLHPDAVPDDLQSADEAPRPPEDWPLPFETLRDVNPRIDLPLSTAACLSARFPVVSPPAFLPQWRTGPIKGASGGELFPLTVKRRYVDGGYYENSGVETAMDVIDALQRRDPLPGAKHTEKSRPLWRPVLIAVHMDDSNTNRQYARNDLSGQELARLEASAPNPRRAAGFDEILGPVSAFFNGWGGPARPVLMRAHRRLRGPDGDSDFIEMNFPHPVILSWYLSKFQYGQLSDQARVLLNGRQGRRLRAILAPPSSAQAEQIPARPALGVTPGVPVPPLGPEQRSR